MSDCENPVVIDGESFCPLVLGPLVTAPVAPEILGPLVSPVAEVAVPVEQLADTGVTLDAGLFGVMLILVGVVIGIVARFALWART